MKKEELSRIRREIEKIVRTTKDKIEKINYVDIHDNIKRVNQDSDLVIFGRRGSGKTTLLLESERTAKKVLKIYIQCETYKEHTYPNLLLSILKQIIQQSLKQFNFFDKYLCKINLWKKLIKEKKELEKLIKNPDELIIDENIKQKLNASAKIGIYNSGAELGTSSETTKGYTYKEEKIQFLVNHLDELRELFSELIKEFNVTNLYLYFDDYYHLDLNSQPSIIDYFFRISKDLSISLKIATIRHRSNLYSRDKYGQIKGIQSNADHTSIDLDFSLENFDSTKLFLKQILKNILEKHNYRFDDFFDLFVKTENGFDRVVWASGGVPRDFLILIMYIIDNISLDENDIKIDKRIIDTAAELLFKEKLQDLGSEYAQFDKTKQFYEEVFNFCVKYNKKTGFLLKNPCEDSSLEEKVKNLMDYRLIHPIIKNMTLNKYRGTFTAYILDIGAYTPFMSIRKEEDKIRELNIFEKDPHKKDELVQFRALSTKQELTIENLKTAQIEIEKEISKIKTIKRKDEYSDFMQNSLFKIN